MITIFNRYMVLRTFEMDKYLNARDDLAENNIDYKMTVRNRRNYNSMAMRKGTVYTGRRFACEYSLYVHRKDYDRAVAVINKKDGF